MGFQNKSLARDLFFYSAGLGAILYQFAPFISNRFVGSADALFYLGRVQDVLTQFRAGVFPVSVGQSGTMFYGPTYFVTFLVNYFICFFDILTFHKLSSIQILHYSIPLSALWGFTLFFIFCRMNILKDNICVFALSLIWIFQPALNALIYTSDSYLSFWAVNCAPLLFWSLPRLDNSTSRPVLTAIILLGLWSIHPPTGIWCTFVASILFFTTLPMTKSRRKWLMIIYYGLSVFFLVGIFGFLALRQGAGYVDRVRGRGFFPSPDSVQAMVDSIDQYGKGFFKGIPYVAVGLNSHFVGWGLFLVLALALYISFKDKKIKGVLPLGLTLFVLLNLLYPLGLHKFFWTYLPSYFHVLTDFPPLRIPIILSICLLFFFIQVFSRKKTSFFREGSRGVLVLCLGLCVIDALKYRRVGFLSTRSKEQSLQLERNEGLEVFAWGNSGVYVDRYLTDPALYNTLFDRREDKVLLSNFSWLRQRCKEKDSLIFLTNCSKKGSCRIHSNKATLDLMAFPSSSEDITQLFVYGKLRSGFSALGFRADNFSMDIDPQEFKNGKNITLSFTKPPMALKLMTYGNWRLEAQSVTIDESCALWYSSKELPIKVRTFPFWVELWSKEEGWLETHRMYLKGYRAYRNQVSIPVRASKRGNILLPVIVGKNVFELKAP